MGKMDIIKALFLGTPADRKRRRKLREEERKAYRKSYRKARIARAKKDGKRKGSTTRTDRVMSAIGGMEAGLRTADELAKNMGFGEDNWFGSPKPKKKPKKQKVYVLTEAKIRTLKKKKKKKARSYWFP